MLPQPALNMTCHQPRPSGPLPYLPWPSVQVCSNSPLIVANPPDTLVTTRLVSITQMPASGLPARFRTTLEIWPGRLAGDSDAAGAMPSCCPRRAGSIARRVTGGSASTLPAVTRTTLLCPGRNAPPDHWAAYLPGAAQSL